MKKIIKILVYFSLVIGLIVITKEIPAQGQLMFPENSLATLDYNAFSLKAESVQPFEAMGQNIDCKKIHLDEDNQEDTIILRRLPNDKIILEISDGAGRFRWSEQLQKIGLGFGEIRDIADINGDGMLEIVVEESGRQSDKYVEIFTYNKASSKKIFAAEGFYSWSIQGAGKEIILDKAKVFRWQDGRYKLIRS